jgi:hypothetical protein
VKITVEPAQPTKLISINELQGRNWKYSGRTKEQWMNAGYYHGLELRSMFRAGKLNTPLEGKARVGFDFDVRQNRRRDGHNYAGTVCKWFIDGMVIAKVFADDSSDYVELVDSTFTPNPKGQLMMRVTVEPL